jgi:formylglycine-generating enzyme required for sulfatase activity
MRRALVVFLLAAPAFWALVPDPRAAAQPPATAAQPISEKLQSVYTQAAQLLRTNRADLAEVNRILQSATGEYPIVQVGTESSTPVWNTLTFNSAGQHLDAIRFTSPLDEPADMFWAFGTPSHDVGRWYILPAHGVMQGFRHFQSELDIDLEGAELPELNCWIFQELTGGEIKPRQEYVLWFLAPELKPRNVHLAIRLVPAGKSPNALSSEQIGRTIGIRWPGPVLTPGSIAPRGHLARTEGARFTSDGQLLAYCAIDQKLKFWDRSTNSWQSLLEPRPATWGTYFEVDPTLKFLVTGGVGSQALEFWDLAQRSRVGTIPAELETVRQIKFTPDGKTLACFWIDSSHPTERRGLISFWDLSTQTETGRIEFPDRSAGAAAFTPDGRALAVTSSQIAKREGNAVWRGAQFLSIFEVPSGKKLHEFKGVQDSIQAIAISRDGQQMFTVEGNTNLLVWDLPRRRVKTVASVSESVWNIALAPDQQRIALAMNDGTVRLWDLTANRTVAIWYAYPTRAQQVSFSPDGMQLVSGDYQIPRIWPVPPRPEKYEHPACGYPEGTLTDSLGLKLVPIPAGRFVMGSPNDQSEADKDERPAHKVKIATPFYLSAHEVTVGQFRQFVDAAGYRTTGEKSGQGGRTYDLQRLQFVQKPELTWRNPGFPQSDDHPVTQVSWEDAQAFCTWLGEKEGVTYRLPTEAEWEYACRAGTKSLWSWGDNWRGLMDMGNGADRSLRRQVANQRMWHVMGDWNDGFAYTAPVGSFLPNQFGLYDMHGNVFEWCADRYEPAAYQKVSLGETTESSKGGDRVCRGGAFWFRSSDCRSASRSSDPPTDQIDCRGFRPVRNAPTTSAELPQ